MNAELFTLLNGFPLGVIGEIPILVRHKEKLWTSGEIRLDRAL